MTRHISTLNLHRLRYGELDGDDLASVNEHLESCERCQRRLGVQQAERNAFEISPLPAALQEAALPTIPANRPMWPRIVAIAAVALAAMAIGFLSLPSEVAPVEPDPVDDGIRAKGDLPAIEVWLDTERGPRALRAGESLEPGDRVQLLYRPEGASWITLVGRDGAGDVEVWGSVEPIGDHLQPAPFGLTLDETPGAQEFHVIRSDRPLDRDEIDRIISGEEPSAQWEYISVPKK